MPYLRHLFSQFFFIFGGIWALVGTPFLGVAIVTASSRRSGDWKEMAIVFGILGAVFGGIGWTLVIRSVLKTAGELGLMKNGYRVSGKVTGVHTDSSMTINGRHPKYLAYAYTGPNGQTYEAKSGYLPKRLESRWKAGDEIDVSCDPGEPSRSAVDYLDLRSML